MTFFFVFLQVDNSIMDKERKKNIEKDIHGSSFFDVRRWCPNINGNNKNNQYRNK